MSVNSGFKVLGSEVQGCALRLRISGVRCSAAGGSGVRKQKTGDRGQWVEGFRYSIADLKARCLVLGAWGSRLFNCGFRILDFGF